MASSQFDRAVQKITSWIALSSLFSVAGYPLVVVAQTTPAASPVAPAPSPALQPPAPQPMMPVAQPSPRPIPPRPVPDAPVPDPVQIDDGYLLGVGDRVRVDIFNVAEYSAEYSVLPDGTLNLPLVGPVSVRGMTLKEASGELASKYARFLRRPIITVGIVTARPVKVAIAGEVNRPGSYTFPPADLMTLTRALQTAGGITRVADIRQIQVRRQRPATTGTQPQIVTVNLWELLNQADLRQDVLLRDGDSIYIPPADAPNLAETRQLTAASFAPTESAPIKIAVVGEVNRPGPHTLTADARSRVTTVTMAIQAAGGIRQTADIRQIEVRRPTRTGGEQVVKLNLWDLLTSGDLSQDIPLQEGDTVSIPVAAKISPEEATRLATASFSPDRIRVNVVGEVARPGVIELPPNTPLNQALLAAGGFNDRAQAGSAELIRLNPNGTVDKRSIPVDYAQAVGELNNPPLQNNDTIVVAKSGISSTADTLNILLTPLQPVAGALGFLRIFGVFR